MEEGCHLSHRVTAMLARPFPAVDAQGTKFTPETAASLSRCELDIGVPEN